MMPAPLLAGTQKAAEGHLAVGPARRPELDSRAARFPRFHSPRSCVAGFSRYRFVSWA